MCCVCNVYVHGVCVLMSYRCGVFVVCMVFDVCDMRGLVHVYMMCVHVICLWYVWHVTNMHVSVQYMWYVLYVCV